ncbi:lamin tail domain-containing protein [bacterium SCSIO 12741]|nr:lamin tail domain-containing protein [bacterium SCSIO 12741]
MGNTATDLTVELGLAETAESGDLVINEVLFDPQSGASSDYVELYNRSKKILDLQNWQLCEFDYVKDTLDGCKIISETPYPLFPGAFVLINKDNAEIKRIYPTHDEKAFIQLASLPTMSNDAGAVVVLNDTAVQIDRFDYTSDMHNALIRDPDGVALERVDYDLPTQDMGNWNSAAQSVGYGTPGLENSQFLPARDFSNQFTVEPETFSPDNDGFDDVVHLNYNLNKDGFVAQVQVYDTEGRLIRDLANNQLLGVQGTITWNGDNDDGQKASTGIYIFFIELVDPDGHTERVKKTCVLAVKF